MTDIHMLKDRKGDQVTTRCGVAIKINSKQSINDLAVTGWEKRVTCPGCVLPGRSPKSGMVMDQEALLNGTGQWGEGYPSVTPYEATIKRSKTNKPLKVED
jgi:hypothetical protein